MRYKSYLPHSSIGSFVSSDISYLTTQTTTDPHPTLDLVKTIDSHVLKSNSLPVLRPAVTASSCAPAEELLDDVDADLIQTRRNRRTPAVRLFETIPLHASESNPRFLSRARSTQHSKDKRSMAASSVYRRSNEECPSTPSRGA